MAQCGSDERSLPGSELAVLPLDAATGIITDADASSRAVRDLEVAGARLLLVGTDEV